MLSSSAALSLSSAVSKPELVTSEERSLVRAFALFTDAAASLERSYTQLQAEVSRLRRELEETNRDLSLSLEQNHRMRQHLDRIVEGLPCGVVVVEISGEISVANPAARRMLDVAEDAPLAVFDDLPAGAARLLEHNSCGDEEEYSLGEGAIEWLTVRQAQLPDDAGGSAIFILRDTSEAKRLEQVQDTLRRRQALAEMSALLAHEIRNPLGSLELFAGLLAETELQPDQREWVGHLRAGLRTLSATVNNVLHFHSPPLLELLPTDLGLMLNSIEEFLRPLAQQASVSIELAHKLDGVQVAADRHRLQQVLLNLALNAFHFMPHGGGLRISGEAVDHTARVEIADSGIGIALENLERVFDPGFTTRPGSPGLGLTVCKTIIEQHGGSISVSSPPQGGTTFTLEFPLAGVES